MAQAPSVSNAPPTVNLDIILRPLEGDEYLVQGVAEGYGETEALPTRFTPDLFTFVEKFPEISQSDLVSYGQYLYELLFPEALTALLYRLQNEQETGAIAQLRLRINATDTAELYDLPWEYLHNGRNFLALSDNLTVIRYLPSQAPVPLVERVPQSVLMVVAASSEYSGADPYGTVEQFMQATHDLRTNSLIDVDYLMLDSAESLAQLRDMLRKLECTTLYFRSDGHLAEDHMLAFKVPGGALYADELSALLRDTAIFTVVLDSLPMEEFEIQRSYAAYAAELVKGGVPTVITLPQFLPTEKHSAFWQRYYNAFFDGAALDTAVSVARQALVDNSGWDITFGMPQFYTRVPHLVSAQSALLTDSGQAEASDPGNLTLDDNGLSNIAQQKAPLSEAPIEQRPLTKGGYDTQPDDPGTLLSVPPADYNAEFVNHVTIPDGAPMTSGQEFTKTWRVRNTGAINWPNDELQIAHKTGDAFAETLSFTVSQEERDLNEIIAEPGRSLQLSLDLRAPSDPGQYEGEWQLQHDGQWFGDTLPVSVTVVQPPEETAADRPVYKGNLRVLDTLLRAGQFQEAFNFARTRLDFSEHSNALAMMIEAMTRAELGPDDPTLSDVIDALSDNVSGDPGTNESSTYASETTAVPTTAAATSEPLTAETTPDPGSPIPDPNPDPQPPRERHIWLYQADGSDSAQLSALAGSADPLIWGANPNTRAGDLVLMYRQSPLQDFAALFTAVTDAASQSEIDLPAGWDTSWTHAVQLGNRIRFEHPLPRQVAHSHPDLSGWNLMRTPQGSLRHGNDLRGYTDGNWPALWTLLLAWIPGQWDALATYIVRDENTLRRDAFASLMDLPASDAKWQAVGRFLQTLPAGHRLWQTAVASDNLTLWQTALAARDQFPPDADTLIAKVEALTFNQQSQRVISLLTELVSTWPGSDAQQARLQDLLARAHQTFGQIDAARSAWLRAAQLDPDQHQPYIRLVNNTPDAELDQLQLKFEQWAADYPNAAGPRAGLATIARDKQQDKAASEHIDAAIARASAVFRAELENLRPVTIHTAAATPVLEEPKDPVMRRKMDRLRRFMTQSFTEDANLADIAAEMGTSLDKLSGDNLDHKIISIVNFARRQVRLLELEMVIITKYRRPYNPTVADWLDRADICLHLERANLALQELDRWRGIWEIGDAATVASRARGYSLHARIHEALQQTAKATDLWLKVADLRPDDTAVYEAIVHTAPDKRLDDIHTALTRLKNAHPDAAGPSIGLAALVQRRARIDSGTGADGDNEVGTTKEAADAMAAELRGLSGSLVQQARARRLVDRLHDEPESVRTISLAELLPATVGAGADGGSTLALTLKDLTALSRRDDTLLQLDDQRRIIEAFLEATQKLPTLSVSHKRELVRGVNYVLHELLRRGRLTPSLIASLHLPVLDALFIDKPAARRALLRAAADYRALPTRRLVLNLRDRARKRLRKQLQAWVAAAADLQRELPDTAVVITELVESGVVTLPGAGEFTLNDLWARAIDDDRRLAQWQQAALTVRGYPAPALPDVAARQIRALATGFWPLVDQLLFDQNDRLRYVTTWDRLQATSLNTELAHRLLHLAQPDSHPDLPDATAVAALRHLGLTDLASQVDAQTTADFCRRLLQDDDLGLQSVDDAALFLAQLAEGVVDFASEPLPANGRNADIWPPLDTAVTIHPNDIATNLILSPDTFRKMASTLSAGSHIILLGPPGTGKTTIAQDVCRHAHDRGHCRGFISATATADWTTFDTVGGYMPNAANQLEFREGIILRAIREQKWLVIDEINRADIDKAFGELFTVLSGQSVTLPYRDGYHPIRILPPAEVPLSPADYVIPESWRILGTMNEYDKASLFQMSFAFMRRFAFVDVAIPADDVFARLIGQFWRGKALPVDHPLHGRLHADIFKQGAGGLIMASRALGPAIAKDMIGYLSQRHAHTGVLSDDDLCEAFLMYALPQFDGMDEAGISRVFKLLSVYFADTQTIFGLRRRLRELFPQYAPAFAPDADIPTLLGDWRAELGLPPLESSESEEDVNAT